MKSIDLIPIKTVKYPNKNDLECSESVKFHMSFRFDKTRLEDFGLVASSQDNEYFNPKDNSKWIKRYLIDLGWGLEVSYCKLPYPSFDQLLHMSLYAKNDNKATDYYCALGILIKDYAAEFIDFTERIFDNNKKKISEYREFYQIVKTQINYDDESIKKRWQDIFIKLGKIV
jgi:hypothetical protein